MRVIHTLVFLGCSFCLAQMATAQATSTQRQQAWTEGLIHGYLAGGEPPEAAICAINARPESVRKSLSYFRSIGTTNFRVLKSALEKDKRVRVTVSLETPNGPSDAELYIATKNSSFCLSEIFGNAEMRDTLNKIKNDSRDSAAKDIYKK